MWTVREVGGGWRLPVPAVRPDALAPERLPPSTPQGLIVLGPRGSPLLDGPHATDALEIPGHPFQDPGPLLPLPEGHLHDPYGTSPTTSRTALTARSMASPQARESSRRITRMDGYHGVSSSPQPRG